LLRLPRPAAEMPIQLARSLLAECETQCSARAAAEDRDHVDAEDEAEEDYDDERKREGGADRRRDPSAFGGRGHGGDADEDDDDEDVDSDESPADLAVIGDEHDVFEQHAL